VVTGYPHLFEPAPGSPNADIIAAINAATDELNATIEQAVTVTKGADVNIRYVDVTADFAGHGIRVPDTGNPFINAGVPLLFTRTPTATSSTPMPSPPHCQEDG